MCVFICVCVCVCLCTCVCACVLCAQLTATQLDKVDIEYACALITCIYREACRGVCGEPASRLPVSRSWPSIMGALAILGTIGEQSEQGCPGESWVQEAVQCSAVQASVLLCVCVCVCVCVRACGFMIKWA
jgi:hypothetical protein